MATAPPLKKKKKKKKKKKQKKKLAGTLASSGENIFWFSMKRL